MTDIVERLRRIRNLGSEHGQRGITDWGPHPDAQEAADEIERLRTALKFFLVRADENTWSLSRSAAELAARNILGKEWGRNETQTTD